MRSRLHGGFGRSMGRSDGFLPHALANYLSGRCYSQAQSHAYHSVVAHVGNYNVPHPNNVPGIQSPVMQRFCRVGTARGYYPLERHGRGHISL